MSTSPLPIILVVLAIMGASCALAAFMARWIKSPGAAYPLSILAGMFVQIALSGLVGFYYLNISGSGGDYGAGYEASDEM